MHTTIAGPGKNRVAADLEEAPRFAGEVCAERIPVVARLKEPARAPLAIEGEVCAAGRLFPLQPELRAVTFAARD